MNQALGFLLAAISFIGPIVFLLAIYLFIRQKYQNLLWRLHTLSRPAIRLGHEVVKSGSATVVIGSMMKTVSNSEK